jgi:hypothetical protein
MVISAAPVEMPRPPIWTSSKMTTSPNPDQYVAVSTVERPVIVAAETALKKAVPSGAPPVPERAIGSMSKIVPAAMRAANPEEM